MKRKIESAENTRTSDFHLLLERQLTPASLPARLLTLLQRIWTRFLAHSKGRQSSLRLVELVGLGEKRFVAVVEYRDAQFLVGGAPGSVALLSELRQVSNTPEKATDAAARAKRARKPSRKNASPTATETRNIVALLDSTSCASHSSFPKRKRTASATAPASTERLA